MNKLLAVFIAFVSMNLMAMSNDVVIGLVYEGLGVQVSDSPDEMIKLHGRPNEIEEKAHDNPYSDIDDAIYKYRFEGFNAYYYKFNHPTHGWIKLTEVTINSRNVKIRYGITIGMSENEVVDILGKPTSMSNKENGNKLLFYSPELPINHKYFPPEHEQLRLEIADGKLVKFSWLNWP